jgi:hypothetical protein
MAEIPKRDITGDCDEGECRDRVKEGEKQRQEEVNQMDVEAPEDYPTPPGAKDRNDPPGGMGGKV